MTTLPGPDPGRGSFILLADRLIDGSGGPALFRPAVTVRDGVIAGVELRPSGWVARAGVRLVEAPGGTILPGLIDTHVHLGFPEEDAPLDPAALRAAARGGAQRALSAGVTTVRDLGSGAGAALAVRDAIRRGEVVGPRILAAGQPITIPGGHCHWFGRLAETAAQLRAAVAEEAAAGADLIKIMVTGGMSTPGSNPYALQFSVEALAAAVAEAHRLGLRVAMHALCTAGVRAAIAAGADTLEHGWTITGRRQDFEPSVAADAARSGIFGSVTAHSDLRALLPDGGTAGGGGAGGGIGDGGIGDGDIAELRRRLIPHRALASAGVPMLVHSDAGPGPTRLEEFAQSIRAFALGMDVTPFQAIRAATSLPAAALGIEALVGTVAVGRVADLLVVDGDPGSDLRALGQVRSVFLGGRQVVGQVAPGSNSAP